MNYTKQEIQDNAKERRMGVFGKIKELIFGYRSNHRITGTDKDLNSLVDEVARWVALEAIATARDCHVLAESVPPAETILGDIRGLGAIIDHLAEVIKENTRTVHGLRMKVDSLTPEGKKRAAAIKRALGRAKG